VTIAACQPIATPSAELGGTVPPPAAATVAPLLGNLGSHTHPITTASELAQKYFDEGLVLAWGFNHEEAIRSFRDAAALDPACAMCSWGIAYALGPNINAPMDPAAVPQAVEAIRKAQELAPGASQAEQDYIAAMAARYSDDPDADRAALDLAYADAMRELSSAYPGDQDAAVLFAEALMDLTPWMYWTKDGRPTGHTAEILATLESVLERNPDHPAAIHFYIHSTEASDNPDRALAYAERLPELVPGAGHLVHMPAHVYWRTGRYHDAVAINEHAAHSDDGFMPDRGARTPFYAVAYVPHNVHFLFAAAQMEGNAARALEAAHALSAKVSNEQYRAMPFIEDYKPVPLQALVRFGRWEEILQMPQVPEEFPLTHGNWHYAMGLAQLSRGEIAEAEHHLHHLEELVQRPENSAVVMLSFATPAQLLDIERLILAAEIAGAQGDHDGRIGLLEEAVALQDALPYIEPPAFFFPVRQLLGQALMDAGRPAEAQAVYSADLRQYRNNGWSLFGLAKSLQAQGKSIEAREATRRFAAAWQHADTALTASAFSPVTENGLLAAK
jgi:tetratricopeptide (TPR) repeat protein